MSKLKVQILIIFLLFAQFIYAQAPSVSDFKPDPVKEKKYFPYLAVRHGGIEATKEWKKQNVIKYHQELWYYTESFYVKRDHLQDGVVLNEEIIDISRFENNRKQEEESIVILPGYKDALVLLPVKNLKYKP